MSPYLLIYFFSPLIIQASFSISTTISQFGELGSNQKQKSTINLQSLHVGNYNKQIFTIVSIFFLN